ncbi:UNKNOWN [Stylonychia lemnae]|uniref:Jacalin-type lectin domain-containing protein n=1 Tax=Stylonychia lemnae TaxID=5949 RepID=A0A078B7A2_STYLE|nr:UNKNOWN [Stylonychia lemnae]|eukprot:CDW90289.1 UNKNOWN [Stylonychia lemnae]
MLKFAAQKEDQLLDKPYQEAPRKLKLTKGFIGLIATLSVIALVSYNQTTDSQQNFMSLENTTVALHDDSQDISLDTIINKILKQNNTDVIQVVYDTLLDPQNLFTEVFWNNSQIRLQKAIQVQPNSDILTYLQEDKTILGEKIDAYLKAKTLATLVKALDFCNLIMRFDVSRSHDTSGAHFSIFGTIYLVLLRERAYNHKDIQIDDLQSAIDTYSQKAMEIFRALSDETGKKISLQVVKERGNPTYTFVNGNKRTRIGSESEDLMTQSRANVQYDNLVKEATQELNTELDALILPSTKWQFFNYEKYSFPYDPTTPKQAALSYSTNFGNSSGLNSFNDEALYLQYGDITSIKVYASTIVEGLQFTYGSVTGPLHGGSGGTSNEITLAQGEQIVRVQIRGAAAINGIAFVTNTGNRYQYGPDGSYFEPSVPNGGYLAGIKGIEGNNSIDQISVIWVTYT